MHVPMSTDKEVNGVANGHANGTANGYANGHAADVEKALEKGSPHGHVDPPVVDTSRHRTTRGGADIDLTDKLTITWVSIVRCAKLTPDGPVYVLRYSRQARYSDRPRSPGPYHPLDSCAAAYPPCAVHV